MTAPVRTHDHQVTLMASSGRDFERIWVTDPAGWTAEIGVVATMMVGAVRRPSEWLVEVRHPGGIMHHRRTCGGAVYVGAPDSGTPWGLGEIDEPRTIKQFDEARAAALAWAVAFTPKLVDPRPVR